MDKDKYSRNIELLCPTCSGTQFTYDKDIDNDHASVRCIGCDQIMTKDELLKENSENIDEQAREIGKEALDDCTKKMKNDLKRAFRGNRHIKIK